MYITNAFSLNMLPERKFGERKLQLVGPMTPGAIKVYINSLGITLESAIGHADTAAVVSADLGIQLAVNRIDVKLDEPGGIVVAQYTGPRLPEGATKLPEGATLRYWLIWEL